MRKVIFAINSTIDGCCDHTTVIADDELHGYYTELLQQADTIVFGRVTYQLMESSWPSIAQNASGTQAVNEFARTIDSMNKIVFSNTLTKAVWKNTRISREDLRKEISKLRQQPGKAISIGGLSIASQLTQLGLIDEYRFVVQPIIAGGGRRRFEVGSLNERLHLKLADTKAFRSGVVALRYMKG